MEDAAIHETDIGDGNALFAVFDGHGGRATVDFLVTSPVVYHKAQPIDICDSSNLKRCTQISALDQFHDLARVHSSICSCGESLEGEERGVQLIKLSEQISISQLTSREGAAHKTCCLTTSRTTLHFELTHAPDTFSSQPGAVVLPNGL